MRCQVCKRRRTSAVACWICRWQRRRNYIRDARPQDALRAMTIPPKH